MLVLNAVETSETGEAGAVSVSAGRGSASLRLASWVSEASAGSPKKDVGDSPSLTVFKRFEKTLAGLASAKPYPLSRPPVGGGVRRYDNGGGVVERPIVVSVLVSSLNTGDVNFFS
jgi:hypothetical protein